MLIHAKTHANQHECWHGLARVVVSISMGFGMGCYRVWHTIGMVLVWVCHRLAEVSVWITMGLGDVSSEIASPRREFGWGWAGVWRIFVGCKL